MSSLAKAEVLRSTAGRNDLPNFAGVVSQGELPRRAARERSSSQTIFSSQTIRGGTYLAVRYGLGVVVSLGNMLVMTRWIGPHAYGLFVTAIGLVAFLSTLARAGVDTYLVRREIAPTAHMYQVASTLIVSISVAVALTGVAMVPLLIRWYGSREFVAPYLALLVTVPVTGLTGIPMAELERRLNFASVAGIELGGQALGLVLSTAFAWARMGVWWPGKPHGRRTS